MDLTLCVTHDCNLACSYCYAGEKRPSAMTWEVAERALDLAFGETPGGGRLQLSFFGGEPLLEWDLLVRSALEAEDRARAAGVELLLTVTTNGTLLTEERVDWLAGRRVALAVSVDGSRAAHDRCRRTRGGGSSFDQTMRGLRLALAKLPDLEAIFVVDPANVDLTAEGTAALVDEGLRFISLNPNFNTCWSDEPLEVLDREYVKVADLAAELYREGREQWINFVDGKIVTRVAGGFPCADRCSFGEGEVAVAPSGRLYPCERLVADDSGELSIGHVDRGFDQGPRAALIARRGNADQECLTCSLRPRCMNWCGCVNVAMTGAIDHVGPLLCFHERLAIREADRVASQLWREQNSLFLRKFYGA